MIRDHSLLPCLLAVGLLAGCAGGPDPAVSPIATPRTAPDSQAEQTALANACRQEADRIVATRDRGQLMREDERDSRVGSQTSIFAQRAETDRLGRIFERDRIASDCVAQNARSAPQR
ncbi:hypothetical protein JYK14_05900 [Siccirubricoccus sp. KC 17139]|uniref:Uncharacterized protein n=1 Tax=Siccirubricoccus soli TaxID=2899147 RepID=A0ABT1D1D1_9PROT|nr:hypothetical protein [Siccirubricoccus soli]MCO6415711.1 hypothetical protein [Siccirubricoccus soli]MCP2681843.1 hypothetical protein [Siccirubricoccus soli]